MIGNGGVRRGRLTVLRGDGLAPLRGADVADGYAQTVGTLQEVYVDPGGVPTVIGVAMEDLGVTLIAADTAEVLLVDHRALVVLPYSASQMRGLPQAAGDPDPALERRLDVRGLFRAWERQEVVDERQRTAAPTPEPAPAGAEDAAAHVKEPLTGRTRTPR